MDKFEKLVQEIMKDAESDGEPVTREEAEEMAKMELGEKQIKRYEKSNQPKERKPKERKVDEEKRILLKNIKESIELLGIEITEVKTETELSFHYNNDSFTLKLIRHKKKK